MISKSVGQGGVNLRNDVRLVQALLNDWRLKNGRKPITVDGKVGPITIAAIMDFQRASTGFVDGRIDPNGRSIKKLVEPIQSQVLEIALIGVLSVVTGYASVNEDYTTFSFMPFYEVMRVINENSKQALIVA